jgi:oligosaccharide reducing-end xylanase
MPNRHSTALLALAASAALVSARCRPAQRSPDPAPAPASAATAGAYATGHYRNLFVEAGHSPAEVDARIEAAFQQLFHGDSATQTVYYPAGSNGNGPLAYLTDINNRDVRSEGMSYGMMIAVQLDKKPEFDALWNWSRTYMYHDSPTHPGYGFFSWSLRTDGTPNSESPAPDGEQYYAMALYFASARWGDGQGIYDYHAEADRLLWNMKNRAAISGPAGPGRTETDGAEFNPVYKMVRFTPDAARPDHTDPSYHLPAFYELWARWGPVADRPFWAETARTSRDFFQKATNPVTGLAPDYANFDGTPVVLRFANRASIFGPDAWRTAANWSVDWSWWAADPRERTLSDRIQAFFASQGMADYGNRFTLDGRQVGATHSTALVATNAVASLAATDDARAAKFAAALWDATIPSGRYRYYDGMWYLMGLMHCAGAFRIWTPAWASAAQRGDSALARLASVAVRTDSLGAEIPRDFIGFSLEVSTAGQGIGAFAGPAPAGAAGAPAEQPVYALGHPGAPNTGYFRFMQNLAPGILRLGGNSQDNSCWDREKAPHPEGCEAGLTAADLRLFSEAAGASGWRLIVGLNLKQNGPAWALREVTDGIAREIPADRVMALEPGNEPDLFFRTPYRPQTYSAADQVRDFAAYVRALQADSVGRRYAIVGPATCCGWRNAHDLALFADGVGPARLKWLTVHNYSATTCGGRTVSAARLLSRELMGGLDSEVRPLVAVARERGLPIAMAETNSASCGGMPGVSNAFASALWGLDYAFTLAHAGFVNVDYHTSYRPGGGSSYNPVDTYGTRDAGGQWSYRNVAEPLYYALYLFSHHAAGRRLLPATVESDANVRAYAVSRCAGCGVTVFVLNKDSTAAGTVRVQLGRTMGTGTLLLLDAPTLGSLAPEVLYGGRRFDSDGHIAAPQTTEVKPGADGTYSFTLPHAAIATLEVAPRSR